MRALTLSCAMTGALLLAVPVAEAAAVFGPAPAPVPVLTAFGPPGLCRPIDIGSAASLPWLATDPAWGRNPDYDLQGLVADTQDILAGTDTVLVHMETLRRAAVYLTQTPDDAKSQPPSLEVLVAALKRDLAKVKARKHTEAELGLATFDLGYALAILDQAGSGSTAGSGGDLLEQACALRPDDPAVCLGQAIGDFDSWWGSTREGALDRVFDLVKDAEDPVARAAVSTMGPLYGVSDYAGLQAEVRS